MVAARMAGAMAKSANPNGEGKGSGTYSHAFSEQQD